MPAKNTKGVVKPSQSSKNAANAEPVGYDHDEGRTALAALQPELEKIKDTELITIRVDVETALLACLAVAGYAQSPGVHAQFARLPKEHFDMAAVDGLGQACSAALFALKAAKKSGVLESEAIIPAEIANEAAEVEGRMQPVCEYLLSDDPEIRPVLDQLRPGTGHRDLANDLIGYAEIYESRHDVVSRDPKHFRPGDAARAKVLAKAILKAISASMSHDEREAYLAYVRSWTLVYRRYEEVRAAGLWLFRADAAKDARFPSLFAVARPNGGRPRKQPAAPAPVVAAAPDH